VRCASATICTDLREAVFSAPTRSAFMRKLPVPLSVPPVTLFAGVLLGRNRFAGDERLIHAGMPFEHHAVHGHLFAGPHAEPVARLHPVERNVLVAAALANAAGRLRSELQQRANGAARVFARAKLQHFAEEPSTAITAAASKYKPACPDASRNAGGNRPGARIAIVL